MPHGNAWAEDARYFQTLEDVERAIAHLLVKTPAIADFLSSNTSKRFIVGSKGYGKTFLLKSKRLLLQQHSYRCLPEDHLLDVTISDAPALARGDLAKFSNYQYWSYLWTISLMTSAIKAHGRATYFSSSQFASPALNELFSDMTNVSPFYALRRLVNLSDREFSQLQRSHDASTLLAYYRRINSQLAIFIDTIDEYLEGYLTDQHGSQARSRYVYRFGDSKIWIVGQLGICRAIRQLMELNSHVKIFTAIRQEALDRGIYYDSSAFTIVGLAAQLTYSKSDLQHMFMNHSAYAEEEAIPFAGSTKPRQGYEHIRIHSPFTRRSEEFLNFALRHTLDCPRDLMRIGGRIAQLHASDASSERVRAAVYAAAKDIVSHYLWEMSRVTDVPTPDIFSVIDKNVMSQEDLKLMDDQYASKIGEAGNSSSGTEGGSELLYRLGLLGVVERTREQIDVQSFRPSHAVGEPGNEPMLPRSQRYLIHPVLDELIAERNSTYNKNYHTVNQIKHGEEWTESKIFKCAVKGDLQRYSRVLTDAVVGQQFSTYLKTSMDKIDNEVEYSALEGGDSVVLVDSSADRLIAAARSLEEAVRRFQVPQSFRFGAALGPIAYEARDSKALSEPKAPSVALVVRLVDKT